MWDRTGGVGEGDGDRGVAWSKGDFNLKLGCGRLDERGFRSGAGGYLSENLSTCIDNFLYPSLDVLSVSIGWASSRGFESQGSVAFGRVGLSLRRSYEVFIILSANWKLRAGRDLSSAAAC